MTQYMDGKVRGLLSPMGEERLERLCAVQTPQAVVARIAEALANRLPPEQAHDVGFHMADWNYNAAFIVALLLFPEQFNDEEIADRIESFLIHVPNHIAAAAKLMGYPVQDIFGVEALSVNEDEQADATVE